MLKCYPKKEALRGMVSHQVVSLEWSFIRMVCLLSGWSHEDDPSLGWSH